MPARPRRWIAAVTKTYDQQACPIVGRQAGIGIVGEFYGNWDGTHGAPRLDAKIQDLPPVHTAENLPGVNRSARTAPANWPEPDRVTPVAAPRP